MKKTLLVAAILAFSAGTANADWFSGNNGEWKMGPYGPYYDESNWPEWTPMYWMEEMTDSFDNNNNSNNNFGGMSMPMSMPYNRGYGPRPMPYSGGYGPRPMPMPYGQPMPMQQQPQPMPAPVVQQR